VSLLPPLLRVSSHGIRRRDVADMVIERRTAGAAGGPVRPSTDRCRDRSGIDQRRSAEVAAGPPALSRPSGPAHAAVMDTRPKALARTTPRTSGTPSPTTVATVVRAVVVTEIVVAAVVVADRLLRRPPQPRLHVRMGPGGWVSVKGGAVVVRPAGRPWKRPRRVLDTRTDARAATGAPWWARVLSAVPLRALTR
jgi:hypothetical protein